MSNSGPANGLQILYGVVITLPDVHSAPTEHEGSSRILGEDRRRGVTGPRRQRGVKVRVKVQRFLNLLNLLSGGTQSTISRCSFFVQTVTSGKHVIIPEDKIGERMHRQGTRRRFLDKRLEGTQKELQRRPDGLPGFF